MIDTNRPIIICGAGASIPFLNSRYNSNGFKHGLDPKLEKIVKSNYSIGLNYWYRYGCETTFNASVDWQFYINYSKYLAKLPLVIACHANQLKHEKAGRDFTHPNTILLKGAGKYFDKEKCWKDGFYTRQLTGIWTIHIAIALGFKEIYLLGYDCKEINGRTHFYQGVVSDPDKYTEIKINGEPKAKNYHYRMGKYMNGKQKGSYKTSTYNNPEMLNKKWYRPFYDQKDAKIYNVSPESVLRLFPRIDYEEFYKRMEKYSRLDQNEAREGIKEFILSKLEK